MASKVLTNYLTGISYRDPSVQTKNTTGVDKVYGAATQTSGDNDLKEALKEIDKKFDFDTQNKYELPESLGLTPMEYSAPTDDQLKELAKAKLTEYIVAAKDDIEKTSQSKKETLRDYLDNIQQSARQKEQNIAELFEDAKKAVAGEALRRGLARSSIVLGQAEALERDKIKEIEKTRNGLLDESNRIQLEIDKLTADQQSALRNLDITYAAKLAMEIADLTRERDQKLQEVQKYNNQIAEKEQQYQIDKLKTEQDLKLGDYALLEKEIKTATDLDKAIEERKQQLKYDLIIKYLMGMNKDAAIKYARDNADIKQSLDDYHYRKLLSALEQR